MLKPPPPIHLPSPEERRDAFNRWMYQFWEWAGDGGAGTAQIVGSAPIAVATGTGSFTVSHNTSGVAAGTYGNSTSVAQVVVDARGHVTSGSSVTIATSAPRTVEGTTPIAVATSTTAFTVSHGTSGVTAGTFGNGTAVAQVVVDALGHVTGGSSVSISFPSPRVVEGSAPIAVATSVGTFAVSHNTSGVAAGTFGGTAGVPRFDISAFGHVLSGTSFPLEGSAPITVGTGTAAFTFSHNTSGVAAGTYGNGTQVPQIVVDARGHVTSGTTVNSPFVANTYELYGGTMSIPANQDQLICAPITIGTGAAIDNAGRLWAGVY